MSILYSNSRVQNYGSNSPRKGVAVLRRYVFESESAIGGVLAICRQLYVPRVVLVPCYLVLAAIDRTNPVVS